MFIKQISVSLDNVPGALSKVSEILGNEGVNIRAISVADTADISTVRFVVDEPVKAINILTTSGYSIKETDVVAVETPDHPGGLNAVLKPLKDANINVHYLYPYLGR
ncbi:MAG: ACT domain-containing protein, partial [Deltaproteobacteria bacterium]|nr:ACT domain-containing protein [Deltaproteobacteria bacterium]